jgi:putative ABC transport system ATP-binding protein
MENLLLAMSLNGSCNLDRACSLLDKVGLGDRKDHLPGQLSIGQQQRVAIARALINRPKLVLADEPTGNLDPQNTDRSLELLRSLCKEWESALILVSHDPRVIGKFEHQIDWEELNQVKESEEVEVEKQ